MAKKMRTRQVHHHRVSVFFCKANCTVPSALLPGPPPYGQNSLHKRQEDLLLNRYALCRCQVYLPDLDMCTLDVFFLRFLASFNIGK